MHLMIKISTLIVSMEFFLFSDLVYWSNSVDFITIEVEESLLLANI